MNDASLRAPRCTCVSWQMAGQMTMRTTDPRCPVHGTGAELTAVHPCDNGEVDSGRYAGPARLSVSGGAQ